jgi:DNA polymerase family B
MGVLARIPGVERDEGKGRRRVTFGPLLGKARRRRIHVYDGEWVPGGDVKKAARAGLEPLALRLIGHYDGSRYRHYTRVPDFLNAVCTRQNSGVWFYAHAGGLADLVFILEYLVDNPRPSITVSCAFSGSSAIIVKITRGKHHWYFVDSYWLLRQPLREIANWVGGEQKGGTEGSTDMFYAPLPELIDYNEADCRILWNAISTFEERILSLGGELQKTIASTAMCLFRRRFLKREIATDERVNEWARLAYHASRVEPFEEHCREADYYDVNSSFPYAMTFPAPGNVKAIGKRLKDGEMGLARVRIRVPDLHVPPTPYRGSDGRTYFPTGEWNCWLNNVDLEWLQERGGKIVRCYESVSFEEIDDLSGYATTIYEWRRSSTDPALKVILKFLLNSLYGKFGEGRQKQKVIINPGPEILAIPERVPGGLGREVLMPGVHAIVEDRDIAHAHVPIAAHITSRARLTLDSYLVQCPRLYYCDTDGFGCQGVTFPESDELGGLKKEKTIFEARFAAPKLYAYRETEEGDWHVKGKGFSRVVYEDEKGDRKTRRLNYDDFRTLLEHKDVYLEQFGRLRALWRDGETTPRQRDVKKRWHGSVRSKRAPEPSGRTRPWHVSELRGKEDQSW